MKKIDQKFMGDHNAPEIIPNPFIENLINHQHKAGRWKSNSFDILQELNAFRDCEVFTQPEGIIDFDGSMFPDHWYLFVLFDRSLPEDFEVCLYLKRTDNEILFEINLNLREKTFNHYPLNPAVVHSVMEARCGKLGFATNHIETDSDNYVMPFMFAAPAQGNMLQTFNQAWAKIEKLYSECRLEVIKTIAPPYPSSFQA